MLRATLTSVLLLAFVAPTASAVHLASCPMMERAGSVERSGCEHCPPSPPDTALRSALPDCCVLRAEVETAVSEPVRSSHPLSATALPSPRLVDAPLAPSLGQSGQQAAQAIAPPPPPRNLPLLS